MRRVNPRTQTPIPATLLIFAGGVLLMIAMPGEALLALITASTILPVLIYAATVILYLSVRQQLDRKEGAFDLGRFELPVAIGALVWLIAATFVLVTPGTALVPVLIVVGLMLVGGVFFAGMLVFDRRSLDAEPAGHGHAKSLGRLPRTPRVALGVQPVEEQPHLALAQMVARTDDPLRDQPDVRRAAHTARTRRAGRQLRARS